MKKITILFAIGFALITPSQAQKASVETVSLSLKTYDKGNKERVEIRQHSLEEAKKHSDMSFSNPTTSNDPKMWLMRARTYVTIQMDTLGEGGKPLIKDPDAIETAITALVNLHKTDDREYYTKTADAVTALVNAALQGRYIGDVAYQNKDYDRAIKYYNLVRILVPYDTEKQLKRNNISDEKLLFNIATAEKMAGKYEDAKRDYKQLMSISYNDPWIYLDLYDIYLNIENDTVKAIETVDKGRSLFEDNQNLKNQQIFVYVQSGRSDELIKVLNENIEIDPYNGGNYYLRGILYMQEGKMDLAEADLKKAVEYDESLLQAHGDLGELYYNKGAQIAEVANKLDFNETEKYNKMNAEVREYFEKAIPHFEKIYRLSPDKAVQSKYANILLAMYLKTEQMDKYKELRSELGQ